MGQQRVQDRDWVLDKLGSLDSVVAPGESFETFVTESRSEPDAVEVLRSADGVKTIQQIASTSSLGEFEVCKVITGALVVGDPGGGDGEEAAS